MDILIKAGQLLLSLSILVIFHELGHYLFAKLFKTRVEKFYLFFNPWFSLFKKQKGETEYGIGWIPLGGYVKISGMIDESMDTEQMKLPPQPWEFRSKPAWQRLLIMIGGVVVNFILALFIYIGILFTWGEEYIPTQNVKHGIWVDSLGMELGLQNGDKIISVNNHYVDNFRRIVPELLLNSPKSFQIDRNGQAINIPVKDENIAKIIKHGGPFFEARIPFVIAGIAKDSPAEKAGIKINDRIIGINGIELVYFDAFKTELKNHKNEEIKVNIIRNGAPIEIALKVPDTGLIGIAPNANLYQFFVFEKKEYSIFASIPAGISKCYKEVVDYLKQIKLIFTPKTEAYKSLGGFIAIGNIFPPFWDWEAFWTMTALLSIMLGVVNILPIPALDGGHVLFLLFEIITRRKPSEKFMEYAQIGGLVILLTLVLFANGNDIIKLFK